MMIKFIGILLIIFSSSWVGISASSRIHNRISYMQRIRSMLDEMATLIRYRSLTLSELLHELSENAEFDGLHFIGYVKENFNRATDFYTAWKDGIDADKNMAFAKEELLSIGGCLGTSDTEGQISALKIHMSRIDGMIAKCQDEYTSKGRLYRSLGVLCGVFITIILI